MPKLWTDTVGEHRHAVREATLDAAAALVARDGPMSVTMSQIAEAAGIGRATLYKYFPDVGSVLLAWHERQVAGHLEQLLSLGHRVADPSRRLEEVLNAYALMSHQHHATQLAAVLHRADHVGPAHQRLRDFIADLISQGAASGDLRADVPPTELATYSLHALEAAPSMSSKAAVRRLVTVTLDGLRRGSN